MIRHHDFTSLTPALNSLQFTIIIITIILICIIVTPQVTNYFQCLFCAHPYQGQELEAPLWGDHWVLHKLCLVGPSHPARHYAPQRIQPLLGDYFRPCSYPVLIPGVYKILPKASLFRPLIHDLSFAKKSAKCFLIQSLQQERVFFYFFLNKKIVYLNCDKNHHLKCTIENANFGQFWAILSRTYELFGDKYKVWELRALEHVESTRMLVGWWVGQRMKPSVDGRRGDRSGWKLVGNSSKWERPVGETTQDGARISHYRQNQNNPTLTKSR